MSNFITRLTGITKADVANAPTSDEVFEKFYDWLEGDNDIHFYCYGDSDITFIQANLKKSQNMKAISALSIIGANMTDYALEVKKYFGLYKTIGLKKLVAYYRGVDQIEQAHDALEDSLFLKEIYEHVSTELPDANAFNDYKQEAENQKKKLPKLYSFMEEDKNNKIHLKKYRNKDNEAKAKEFPNLYLAIMSCIDSMRANNSENFDFNSSYPSARQEILNAIENGQKYCNYYWKKIN